MRDRRIPELSTVRSPPRESLEYNQLKNDRTEIGSGGQGFVYRVNVSSPTLPEQVAIKEPAAGSDTIGIEDMEALLHEADTWEDLDRREREKPRWNDSEHIVGVIDVGDEEIPWIAMEYMDGGGLDDRLEANPNGIPVNEALWFGECICRGIEVAHNYGIVHLDLKPSNVLFRTTSKDVWDVPKIADWGLSRELTEQTGTMEKLSVLYAAPEQFDRKKFGDPDMLTDVYQVGALVYAMLTGNPPYTGEQASVMHDIVYGDEPTPPSKIRENLPTAIDEVVLKALTKEKTNRYRNIGALEEALHALRTDQPPPNEVSQSVTSKEEVDTFETKSIENSEKPNISQLTNENPPQKKEETKDTGSTQNTSQAANTESGGDSKLSQKQNNLTPFENKNFRIKNKRFSGLITGGVVIFGILLYILIENIMGNPFSGIVLLSIINLPPIAGGIAAGWYKLGFSVPVIASFGYILTILIADTIRGETFVWWAPVLALGIAIIVSVISFKIAGKLSTH